MYDDNALPRELYLIIETVFTAGFCSHPLDMIKLFFFNYTRLTKIIILNKCKYVVRWTPD